MRSALRLSLLILCSCCLSLPVCTQNKPEAQSAVTVLADKLAAAKNDDERRALLTAEKHLVTEALVRELIDQGNRLTAGGRYDEALVRHRLAQSIAEQLNDRAGIALALHRIGNVHFMRGDYDPALEHYQRSLVLRQALDDRAGIAALLNNIGNIHHSQGNYTSAIEFRQKALALFESLGNKPGMAAALENIGNAHSLQGNYPAAREYYQKCLALREEQRDRSGVANTLGNIGVLHLHQDNHRLALEYFQKSLTIREALGDRDGTAVILNNIGKVHHAQGNYGVALDYYRKSLALSEALGNRHLIAGNFDSIAAAYDWQGDFKLAADYYRKSLPIHEAMNDREGMARALNGLGLSEQSLGNYARALDLLGKALALNEAIGDKRGMADRLLNIGETHRLQGSHAQALEAAERAANIAAQIEGWQLFQEARTLAGLAQLALDHPAEARRSFAEAIATIETMRADVAGVEQERQQFFERRVLPYYGMVRLMAAQNQPFEALGFAERARARVLVEALQNGRVSITRAMTSQEQEQEQQLDNQIVALNTQISRENLRPQPDAVRLSDLKAQLQKARLEYEAFQTGLYAVHPELKVQRGEAQPPTLEQARTLLPDAQSALLEYVMTDERTYLFALTGNAAGTGIELKLYPLEIRRRELSDRAARFRETLAKGSPGFRPMASELYDLLLKPAAAQLQGRTALVIVPDGALWELPFQALQPAPDRYLLEDCAIAYAPSLTALREMSRRRGRKNAAGAPTLLAFGNPALGQQTIARARSVLMDEKLDPLPEAERQVNALRQIYGTTQSRIYTGSEAREDRVKKEAGGWRILHLATHGILNDSSPMYSHVLLAQEGSGNEDGLLEAWEIMKLDLQADLAVLSACETARGRVSAGEGMIGLSWALFVAGCPTTVVSQWKVDSASTTELMLEFHRRLKAQMTSPATPFSAARALREAALRLQRNSQYRHPFYWAGFVVAGKGF